MVSSKLELILSYTASSLGKRWQGRDVPELWTMLESTKDSTGSRADFLWAEMVQGLRGDNDTQDMTGIHCDCSRGPKG